MPNDLDFASPAQYISIQVGPDRDHGCCHSVQDIRLFFLKDSLSDPSGADLTVAFSLLLLLLLHPVSRSSIKSHISAI